MQIEINHDKPNVKYTYEEQIPGFAEGMHTVRLAAYVVKHASGGYTIKDRYIAWTGPRNKGVRKMAEQLLIDDMQAIIKKGRYHLWSYK
jgi:molybdopterin biosynthesis enzyme MoaB